MCDADTAISYMHNQLTPEQDAAFEEHFFGCEECAANVMLAFAIYRTFQAKELEGA